MSIDVNTLLILRWVRVTVTHLTRDVGSPTRVGGCGTLSRRRGQIHCMRGVLQEMEVSFVSMAGRPDIEVWTADRLSKPLRLECMLFPILSSVRRFDHLQLLQKVLPLVALTMLSSLIQMISFFRLVKLRLFSCNQLLHPLPAHYELFLRCHDMYLPEWSTSSFYTDICWPTGLHVVIVFGPCSRHSA